MWEQDEAADLAFELQGIKRIADNEVWGYVTQGTQVKLQSLFDAQSLKLQADGAKIEASNARINAAGSMAQSRISAINANIAILEGQNAVAQGNAATDASFWNMLGSIGGFGFSMGEAFATRR